MADNTIDTLELQIISNANKADASLDRLARKLMDVNRSFNALNGGGLRKFAKEIGTVGAAANAFSKIKIKMPEISGMTKEVDRMEKYITGASKKIAQSFSDAFNIKGANLSSVQKQIQEIGTLLSSGKSGAASDLVATLGEDIIKVASSAKYMDDEMQSFYKTLLKVGKIKVSPDLPKAMPDEWKNMDGLLRQKISTQTGTELDSLMQEWKNNFKGLFSDLDTDTVEDQFIILNNLVKQCREGIANPLAKSGLLDDAVWEKVVGDLGNFEKEIRNIKSALEATGGTKQTENIGLEKFISDFRKLSGIKADGLAGIGDSLSGLAKGISDLNGISIDINPVMQAVNMIESLGKKKNVTGTENLRQISSNLQDFANSVNSIGNLTSALTSLSSINFDSNNLSKVINSLKNLLSVKMDSFNVSIFPEITGAINTLANVPDVSNSLNRFIASLAKLAGAGSSIGAVAGQLPNLGTAVKMAVDKIASAGNVSESVNTLVQSIARLAGAGAKTGQTASGLGDLAEETLKFFQAMTKAPKISQNTIAMTKALAQLASAGGSVGTTAGTVSNAFNKLSGLGGKTANALRKAASSIVSSFKSIGSGSKHLNIASSGFGRFIKSVLPYVGFYQLFNLGKQAVGLSSNLTEVQNVVDVTFGNMTDKIDEFTKNSIQQFGMSELSAKQFASRFQAMGSAMGISKSLIGSANDYLKDQTKGYIGASNAMADMSLNLTKLTADMASFYNVEQKSVAEDLESIFTGQTRPLRAYGLDLTQATLQEWALKQGLDADMQSMSQAEKTMLRYQYVLANTTAAHGDFSRTADTWANRTRVLSQQFQQLGSIVGGTFINAFKPFVAALNSIMQKVISFAETISAALGAIFGWKIEVGGGGVTNDLGDLSGGMDDVADSTGDAAGAAEKLKKTLSVLPFDQLNQLASDMDKAGNGGSGGGSGAGGGAGAGSGASAAIVPTETIFDKYESDIKTLEQLGGYIGDALKKAMDSIPWDDIYKKAEGFGTGLANFLNGVIRTPGLFDSIGATVAGALNTPLHALDSFGKTFDWTTFGTGLAEGLNSFFEKYDFGLLASSLDTWANGLFDAMIGFVDTVEWGGIGDEVADFVKDALGGIEWNKSYEAARGFGSGLATFLNKLLTPNTFSQIGSTIASGLKTALTFGISFISTFDWHSATVSLLTSLTTFITDVNWKYLAKVFGFQMKRALWGIRDGIAETDWNEIGQNISDFISGIPFTEILSGVGELIWTAINAGIDLWKGIFGIDTIEDKINGLDKSLDLSALSNGLKTLGEALSPFVKGFAEGFIDVMDFLANTVTPAVISALGTAFELLGDALNAIPPEAMQKLGESLGKIGASLVMIKGANAGINAIKGLFTFLGGTKAATDVAKGGLESVGKAAGGTSKATEILQAVFGSTGGKMAGMISAIVYGGVKLDELADAAEGGNGKLSEFGGIMDSIRTNFAPNVSKAIFDLKEEIENAGGATEDTKQKFVDLFTAEGISPEALQTAFNDVAGSVGATVEQQELLKGIIDGVAQSSENMAEKVETSGESTESAYGRIRQAIKELGDESGFYGEQANVVLDALKQQEDSGSNAKTAFQYLLDTYGNMEAGSGTLADALNGKLKGSFDNLESSAQKAADKSGNLSTKIGGIEGVSVLSLIQLGLMNAMFGNLASSGKDAEGKVGGLGTAIVGLVSNISGKAEKLKNDSKELFGNVPKGGKEGIDDNASLVETSIKNLADNSVIKTLKTLLGINSPSTVADGFGLNFDQGLANGIANNQNLVTSAITAVVTAVKDLFPLENENFKAFGTTFMAEFKTGISEQTELVKADASGLIDALKGIFPGYNSDFYSYGKTFMSKIGDGITGMMSSVSSDANSVANTIKRAFDFSLYSKGKSVAGSFVNGLTSVHIPLPHVTLTTTTSVVGNTATTSTSSSVKWYKKGGLFNFPSVIGVGEAGKEAVLPLENKHTMSMISDSITQNMDGGFGLSKDDMRQAVAEGVAIAMMNNQDNRPINLYATLYTEDNEVLARAVTRGQQKIDYRMNPTPSFG